MADADSIRKEWRGNDFEELGRDLTMRRWKERREFELHPEYEVLGLHIGTGGSEAEADSRSESPSGIQSWNEHLASIRRRYTGLSLLMGCHPRS